MSRIYLSTESDGEGAWSADASYEPPMEGWTLADIEMAEAGSPVEDDEGQSLAVVHLPAFMLVVTWEEPETGVAAFGPYGDSRSAEADWGRVSEQFMNDGQMPEDVEYHVVEAQG